MTRRALMLAMLTGTVTSLGGTPVSTFITPERAGVTGTPDRPDVTSRGGTPLWPAFMTENRAARRSARPAKKARRS